MSTLRQALGGPLRAVRHLGERSELTWRYGIHLLPTMSHLIHGQAPSGEALRVLTDLNRDGIAVTSVDALLGPNSGFSELREAAAGLELDFKERLEQTREALRNPSQSGSRQKPYVVPLLGDNPRLDASSVFGRFSLQAPICQIADSYYGMACRLWQYNIWHNVASQNAPSQSQLWHRDPEERYILKAFVYLTDVDEGAGPFTYARGSHQKGARRCEPAYSHKDGDTPRSNDEQMAASIPREHWLTATGEAGTMIFADTRGHHKGGLARDIDRILFLCQFTSSSSAGIPAVPPKPHS